MADLFDITGIPAVTQALQQLRTTMLLLGGIAVQQEAEAILEASQPLVPVDTGALKASGAVIDAAIHGETVEAGVFYGGPGEGFERTPSMYAAFVEFDVTKRHPHGGQSHYLTQPTMAATQGMLERIAEQLRNAF